MTKTNALLLATALLLLHAPSMAETAVTEVGKTLATQAIDASKLPASTTYCAIRNSPYVVLRAQPKLESAAVATLDPADKILVIGRSGDWVQVTTTKGTGWMRAYYLLEPAGGAPISTPGALTPGTAAPPTATTATGATPPPQPGTVLTTSPATPSTPTRISDTAAPPATSSGGNNAPPPKVEAPPATAKGPKALYGWLQAAGLSGENLKMAWAISMGESGGNPRAFNGNAKTGDKSYGLFQINMIGSMGPARLKQFGLSSNEQLFDPMTNIKAMLKVSGNCKNWNPWSVYKHGTYKKFLSQYPPK